MSEVAIVEGVMLADDAAKMLTAAFNAAKAKHDVAALSAADRTQLLAIMESVSKMLAASTDWIMSNPQSSNGR